MFGIRKEIPYGSNAIQAHNEHPDNILQYHATKIFDQQAPPSSPEYHAKLRNAAEARVGKKLSGLAQQNLPPDHIESEIDSWDIHDQEILERKLFSIEQEHGPGTVAKQFKRIGRNRLANSAQDLNTAWDNYHSLNPGEDIHTRNRQQGLPSTRDIYGRDSMKLMYPDHFTDAPKDESL